MSKPPEAAARCVWLTGLSGAGKSTLAERLAERLNAQGRPCTVLDGDRLRTGLCSDLGFSAGDRAENMRRVGEVARLMVDAGLFTIVSLISPFRAQRDAVRQRFRPGEFIEVHVDTPLAECARRDVKGLYARAYRGEIKDFTGIDSPYEAPLAPELRLPAGQWSVEACTDQLLDRLIPPA